MGKTEQRLADLREEALRLNKIHEATGLGALSLSRIAEEMEALHDETESATGVCPLFGTMDIKYGR